jgi:hypothetical protein
MVTCWNLLFHEHNGITEEQLFASTKDDDNQKFVTLIQEKNRK